MVISLGASALFEVGYYFGLLSVSNSYLTRHLLLVDFKKKIQYVDFFNMFFYIKNKK